MIYSQATTAWVMRKKFEEFTASVSINELSVSVIYDSASWTFLVMYPKTLILHFFIEQFVANKY